MAVPGANFGGKRVGSNGLSLSGVSKLQVAILARSSWEMSQIVRID